MISAEMDRLIMNYELIKIYEHLLKFYKNIRSQIDYYSKIILMFWKCLRISYV